MIAKRERQNEKQQDKGDKGKRAVECKDKVVRRKRGENEQKRDSAEGREIKRVGVRRVEGGRVIRAVS